MARPGPLTGPDVQPRCARCGHRHRPELTCWTRPHSTAITAALLADDPPCWLRYPRCTGRATEADHLTPRALGGTDDPANLRPACPRCNRRRAHRPPFDTDPEQPPAGLALSNRWTT